MDHFGQPVRVALVAIAIFLAVATEANPADWELLTSGTAARLELEAITGLLERLQVYYEQSADDGDAKRSAKLNDVKDLLERNKKDPGKCDQTNYMKSFNVIRFDHRSNARFYLNQARHEQFSMCGQLLANEMKELIEKKLHPDTINAAHLLKSSVLGDGSSERNDKVKLFVDGAHVPAKLWGAGLLEVLQNRFKGLKVYQDSLFSNNKGRAKMLEDSREFLEPLCGKVQADIGPQVRRVFKCFPQLKDDKTYKEVIDYVDDTILDWIDILKLCSDSANMNTLVINAYYELKQRSGSGCSPFSCFGR